MMPKAYWGDWKFTGIYGIFHVESGKVYVGQAQCLRERIYQHRCLVGKKPHPLYRAVAKYGWEAFEIIVLEHIEDLARLDEREQHWMDTLRSYDREHGYNIAPHPRTCRGVHYSDEIRAMLRGRTQTAETRAKIGAAQRGKVVSPETREKISAAAIIQMSNPEARAQHSAAIKGRVHSTETRAKMSASHKVRLATPDGKAKQSAAANARWQAKKLQEHTEEELLCHP
jgi:group I intron endonuclease